MIDRPSDAAGTDSVANAADALEWLSALHHRCFKNVMVRNAPIQDPAAAKQT